ncbi:MAG: ribbon-helix-helix protein, CopG family, partial [Gaiella sp.]
MRTTVTLDPDVAALLDAKRARTGKSFKGALDRPLRRAGHPSDEEAQ